MIEPYTPEEFELHLGPSTDLVKKYSRKIKKVGGSYLPIRSGTLFSAKNTRVVLIPNTILARQLGNELIAEFGRNNKDDNRVLMRGEQCSQLPLEVIIQNAEKLSADPIAGALGDYNAAFTEAVERGMIKADE